MRKNIFKDSKRWMTMALASAMVLTTVANNGVVAKAANAKAVKKVTVKIGKKNVTKKKITLVKGKSASLKVAVSPKSAKKSVSYKTSAKKFVTVNKKGKITAKKAGKAKITITVKGKNNKKKTTYVNVTVKNPVTKPATKPSTNQQPTQPAAEQEKKLSKITVTSELSTIDTTGQTQLKVVSATDGVAIAGVTYKSDNEQILTVDATGKVTGVKPGTGTIKVTARDAKGNEVSESISITVREKVDTTLSLNNTSIVLPENGIKTITALVGSQSSSKKVTWTSSDPSVASVQAGENNTGIVKGIKSGNTTITATVEGTNISKTCAVTVTSTSNAIRVTGAAQTEYNKVQVNFSRAVTAEEQKKLTFLLKSADGNEIEITEAEWASNGTSVVVNNSSAISAGMNTIEVRAEKNDVSIDENGNQASFTATAREVKKIEFVNKYLPVAMDADNKQLESKKVRVRFKALDNNNSQYEKVDPRDYTFSIKTNKGSFSLSESDISKTEKDAISFNVPSVANPDDQITITVSDNKGNKIGEGTYTFAYLSVDKVDIKGIKNNDQLYQDEENDQEKVLDCICYNNKGEVIDLLDGNYNKINVEVAKPDPNIYIDAINVYTKEIKVIVKKGAYTKKGEPVVLQINNTDGISRFSLEVRQQAIANKIEIKDKATAVIAGDKYEPAKLPITVYDQYGDVMPYEQLSIAKIKKSFEIFGGSEVEAKWNESALEIVEDNGNTYLQISGAPLVKTTDDPKKTASVNVRFVGKLAENEAEQASVFVTIKDARKPSKFLFNKDAAVATSLYQNESVTYKYEVQDQYGKVYEATPGEYAKLAEVKDRSELSDNLNVKFDYAKQTVTITADNLAPKGDSYDVKFGVKNNNDTSSYLKRTFGIKENFANLKVSFKDTKKKTYTAGEKITLKVEAVDKSGKTITSYNASNVQPFNTQQDGKNNLVAENGITFENGVAYIDVKASKATDAAYYSFATTLPGRAEATYGTKQTDAANTIKIVAGERAKFGVTYNSSTKKAEIAIQDSEGNNITSDTTSNISINIKVNGVEKASEVLTFNKNGVATYTFTEAVASGATISVSDSDGKLKGEYVVAK